MPDGDVVAFQHTSTQVLAYVATAINELGAGQAEGIAGALPYPRPASAKACRIEAADEQAIIVTCYDAVDWRR